MIIKNGKRLDGFCVDSLPIGTLQPYLGLKAPNGYLICDGSLISKMVYPELYAICGSLFGVETDTHFYLPDLRGKTIAGYNADDSTLNTIGKLLGSASHTHTTGNHTLTIAEMPEHSHAMSHAGNLYFTEGASARWMPGVTDDNIYADGTTDSAGGSQPHNHGDTGVSTNYQPTMVANWIVKAKMIVPITAIVENSLASTSETNASSAAQGKILDNKINNTNVIVQDLQADITSITSYLNDLIRIVDYATTKTAWNAGERYRGNITITVPDGYQVISIIPCYTSYGDRNFVDFNLYHEVPRIYYEVYCQYAYGEEGNTNFRVVMIKNNM